MRISFWRHLRYLLQASVKIFVVLDLELLFWMLTFHVTEHICSWEEVARAMRVKGDTKGFIMKKSNGKCDLGTVFSWGPTTISFLLFLKWVALSVLSEEYPKNICSLCLTECVWRWWSILLLLLLFPFQKLRRYCYLSSLAFVHFQTTPSVSPLPGS